MDNQIHSKKAKMQFSVSIERMAGCFKALETKTPFEVACEFGIDKYFDSKKDITNYMYRMYLQIKNDPGKYGISEEKAMQIQDAVQRRNTNKSSVLIQEEVEEKLSNIKEADIKDIVIIGRNKASILMDKKMNMLLKSKKALEKESIVSLAKVFGIYFDKSQIVMGQATENIALMAKVDENLTPEQAMDALLKHREKTSAEKADNK